MAKGKSKSSTRDATTIASSAGLKTNYSHLNNPYNITPYPAVLDHDRRLYKPDKTTRPPTNRPPAFARLAIKVVNVKKSKRQFHAKLNRFNPLYRTKSHVRKVIGFSVSRRLEMCIRRHQRKEVLFAKRKAGKAGQRKSIRNFWSAIRC